MTVRVGFFVRLAALIAVGLMVIQLVLVWLYLRDRDQGDAPGYRFPLPERVAAIVDLVEQQAGDGTTLIALNGPDLRVDIVDEQIFEFVAPETNMPGLEERFQTFVPSFGERPFAIYVDAPDDIDLSDLRWGDTTVWTRFPVRVLVGLQDGRVLSIETRDDLLTQVYSVPLGWWSGIFAVTAALLVLFVVRRETRPIEKLAQAVERFGADGKPALLAPQGAVELRSLIGNFNAMQVRISELMERQGIMLGALGHDLRTYLTRLTLRIEEVPDDVRPALERNIQKMGDVVESSLEFARGASFQADRSEVELAPYLRDWVAERAEPRLSLGPLPDVCALVNPVALDRTLTNLVENALRFGAHVRVDIARDPVAIRVLDDGPGIPEDELHRVLQPFVTLDYARTVGRSGTGLGLSIADLMIRDMGGTLVLTNRPEGGLCASVTLRPCTRGAPNKAN